MAEQFISKFDGTTSDNLLTVVNENQGVFPFDTELNESSSRGLPNSVIAKEINAIKDATSNNKGYFLNEEKLKSAYPTASKGSKAYVGNNYPYAIYLYQSGAWTDSGQTGGDDSFNAGEFYTKTQIDQKHEAINNEISRVEKGANYEVLEYEVNIATTRLKVKEKNRKGGYMITYNAGTGWIKEQYIGELTDNEEWIKDENWDIVLEDSGIQAIAEDARLQAQTAQAAAEEAVTQSAYAKEQAQAAQAVVGSIFESAPINTIMRTTEEAGNIFGSNWLKCDGSQVSAIDYPSLRAKVISSIWQNKENTYGITKCAYGNGIYVAIGRNKTATSKDGINWEEHTVSFTSEFITYFDGFFYCDSNVEGEYIVRSRNGINWNKIEDFKASINGLNHDISIKDITSDDNYLYINVRYDEISGGVDGAKVVLFKDEIFYPFDYGTDTGLWIGGSYGSLGLCILTDYFPSSPRLSLRFISPGKTKKTVEIPTEYTEYFKNGWIGCEYINGKYVIATDYLIEGSEGCAIFTTTNGEDLTKVADRAGFPVFTNLVNDKNRLLWMYDAETQESTDGSMWNTTSIPPYGYYCRGDKMIVIDDASTGSNNINYSINNLQLPNIENHYIKAKQP